MISSLSILAVVLSLASAVPLNNREDIDNLDNSIDVDERPSKQVEPSHLGFFCLAGWLGSMTVFHFKG